MDLIAIIEQLPVQVYFALPILILISIIKSPWFKGRVGEFLVNSVAKATLDKDIYHLIKNVTLPTEDGTTQIDHVIVSVHGVFVIETKNMKGWIFGNKNQKQWTQRIFKETHKFQNPLFQNYKHTKTLEALLGLTDHQIFSVIAFMGNSTFKSKMPENVTSGGGYVRYIKSKKEQVLTEDQVKEIIDKIETGRLNPSFKTDREHVAHLKKKLAERENSREPVGCPDDTIKQPQAEHETQHTCPKCGGLMVMREFKKGAKAGKQFWGCSNYPRCRGMIDSSE